MRKIFTIFIFHILCIGLNFNVFAQNAMDYIFTQNVGMYTPFTSGTEINSGTVDNSIYNVTMSRPFTFLGVPQTEIRITSNGIISFPDAANSNSVTAYTYNVFNEYITYSGGSVSAFGADLEGYSNSKISHGADGDEFVIQWSNFRRYYVSQDTLNFQIRLNTVSGEIKIVYGRMYAGASGYDQPAVGIRGTSQSDFSNRSVTVNEGAWVNSLFGPSIQSLCYFNGASQATKPAIGTTFTFSSPTCIAPLNIIASNSQGNSVDVSWTASVSNPAEGYEYYYSTSNTYPAASVVGTITTGTSTTVSNLNAATSYNFWVRSVCSSNDKSNWSMRSVINTTCSPGDVPYSIDFETPSINDLPICTTVENAGDGNIWEYDLDEEGNSALRYLYDSNEPADTWFYTNGINLTAGLSYRIAYRYKSGGFDESLKVAYGSSADAASMVNTLNEHPIVNNEVYQENPVFVDFTPTVTGVHYFGFQAYSGADEFALFLDDISVTATPTCIVPSSLVMTSITTTTATVTWTDENTPSSEGFKYYITLTNVAPTGVGMISTTNSATVIDLISDTEYYFWVKASCSSSDSSTMVRIKFRTPCSAVNVPYSLDFEGLSEPELPNCTSTENTGSGNDWETYDDYDNIFLSYTYNDLHPGSAWFYTQGINLVAGTAYKLSYRFASEGGNSLPEAMRVAFGNNATSLSMTTVLNDHPVIANEEFQAIPVSVIFSPTTSGVYYVGFYVYSLADQYLLKLDDILVEEVSCSNPIAFLSGGSGGCSTSNFTPAEVVLTGNAPWTITFSNGVDTEEVTATSSPYSFLPTIGGVYSITSMSDASCAGTATGTSTFIHTPSVTFNNNITICSGDTYVINGNTYSTAGTYNDVFSLANGCDSLVVTTLTIATFQAEGVFNTTSRRLEATLVPDADYTWINCATNAIVGLNANYTPLVNGEYKLQVKLGECVRTSACIEVADLSVALLEASNINIFPNPTLDKVRVEAGGEVISYITVIDQKGLIIQILEVNDVKAEVSLRDLSEGIYFLEIQSNIGRVVKRVTKL